MIYSSKLIFKMTMLLHKINKNQEDRAELKYESCKHVSSFPTPFFAFLSATSLVLLCVRVRAEGIVIDSSISHASH